MKKIIPLLLALTLVLSLGGMAFADEGQSRDYTPEDKGTLDQKVQTTVPEGKVVWNLKIPANVTITAGGYDGKQDAGQVEIEIVSGKLEGAEQIEAYLNYDGVLAMNGDITVKLPYGLSWKTPDSDGQADGQATLDLNKDINVGIMTATREQYEGTDAWVKAVDWDAAASGTYVGTVTYSSKYVDGSTGNNG